MPGGSDCGPHHMEATAPVASPHIGWLQGASVLERSNFKLRGRYAHGKKTRSCALTESVPVDVSAPSLLRRCHMTITGPTLVQAWLHGQGVVLSPWRHQDRNRPMSATTCWPSKFSAAIKPPACTRIDARRRTRFGDVTCDLDQASFSGCIQAAPRVTSCT